jgi:chromosome segregation ATPase
VNVDQLADVQADADTAQATADQALDAAGNAQSTADQALDAAGNAQSTADQALDAAGNAQSTADQALDAAGNAQATADTALAAAGDAQATADEALDTANTAQGTAETALDTANTALATASGAVEAANTYTDEQNAAQTTQLQGEMAAGDAATLQTANTYTDTRSAQTLQSANAYTDHRISGLQLQFDAFQEDVWDRLAQTDQRVNRSGAMQTAMAQMSASAAGLRTTNRMAVGVGYQGGESALSVGYQRALGENATFTLGGAISGDESTAGAGVGFGW